MAPTLLMPQQDIDAQPDLWKSFRRAGITASEISSVLGIAPDSWETASPFALFVAKTSGEEAVGDSDEMARGRHLEPYVAERYQETRPALNIFPGGLYSSAERTWQMATFDRLVLNPVVTYGIPSVTTSLTRMMYRHAYPAQLKTATSRYDNRGRELWGEDGSDQIPSYYRAQSLWEMDVWDADQIDVPCLFMNDWQLRVYRIYRDEDSEADIISMREAAEEFLGRIKADDSPPVDWTPATTKALKTLHPGEPHGEVIIPAKMASRYRAALAAADKTKHRVKQVTNEILAYSGDARDITTLVKGQQVKVATRSKYKQHHTDTKTLKARYPVLAKELELETTVQKITAGTWASPPKERKIRD